MIVRFPTLNALNNPNLTAEGVPSALSTNRTQLTSPGYNIEVTYDAPGQNVSYNNSYMTVLGSNVTQTENLTCVFIAQLNATSVPFTRSGQSCVKTCVCIASLNAINVTSSTGNNSGYCTIPAGQVRWVCSILWRAPLTRSNVLSTRCTRVSMTTRLSTAPTSSSLLARSCTSLPTT